jgi:hypothetical protein
MPRVANIFGTTTVTFAIFAMSGVGKMRLKDGFIKISAEISGGRVTGFDGCQTDQIHLAVNDSSLS